MTTFDPPVTGSETWPSSSAGQLPPRLPPRHEALPKRVAATIGFLADATRRRRSGRLVLWTIVVLLAVSGVGLLSYPIYTDFWAHRTQSKLRNEFLQTKGADKITLYKSQRLIVGHELTRLVIPKIHVDVIVVEGVTGNALRAGAGHYPDTALPGDPGNVAIAGHRTGFGEPFRHLEQVAPGDQIILETPIGTYTYEVIPAFDDHANPWITVPSDLSVKLPTADPSLTLTTCDPPHTSLNRMIVRAKLIKSVLKT